MKPRIKLATTQTATNGMLALYEHDGAYSINFNGQELMHSKACASEKRLGEIGVATIDTETPTRVLLGGLGLGFTLQSALNALARNSVVEVAELIPAVVDWNRDHLQALNGSSLDDPRVEIHCKDVVSIIRKAKPETYDAIMLDIDNGPIAMVAENNASLYSKSGVRLIRRVLKTGGRVVFWSASRDEPFETRLRKADFKVQAIPAKIHESAKRAAYLLYVADK